MDCGFVLRVCGLNLARGSDHHFTLAIMRQIRPVLGGRARAGHTHDGKSTGLCRKKSLFCYAPASHGEAQLYHKLTPTFLLDPVRLIDHGHFHSKALPLTCCFSLEWRFYLQLTKPTKPKSNVSPSADVCRVSCSGWIGRWVIYRTAPARPLLRPSHNSMASGTGAASSTTAWVSTEAALRLPHTKHITCLRRRPYHPEV